MLRPKRGGLPTTAGYGGGDSNNNAQSPYEGQSPGYASPGFGSPGFGSPSYGSPGYGSPNYGSSGGGNSGSSYGGYTGGAAYGGYSGAGGSTSAVSNNNEGYKEKPNKRRKQNVMLTMLMDPLMWTGALAVLFFILTVRYRLQSQVFLKTVSAGNFQEVVQTLHSSNQEKNLLRVELRTAKESYKKSVATASEMESENRKLQTELKELKLKYDSPEQRVAEKLKMDAREQALKSQVQLLQQATSRESRRAATEK